MSWGYWAADWLRDLAEADGTLEFVRDQVDAENWQLLAVIETDGDAQSIVGACVYSVEIEPKSSTLVVNYLAGKSRADITRAAFDFFDSFQRATNMKLRFWTAREGLRRKLERQGFGVKYVMERAANGQ